MFQRISAILTSFFVVCRPLEPKIKYYSELRCTKEQVNSGDVSKHLTDCVEYAITHLLQPDHNSLTRSSKF